MSKRALEGVAIRSSDRQHALPEVDVRPVDRSHKAQVDEKARRAPGKAVRSQLDGEVAHGPTRLQGGLSSRGAVAHGVDEVVLADLDAGEVGNVHHARRGPVPDDDALARMVAQARLGGHGLERALQVEPERVPLHGLDQKTQRGDLVAVHGKLLEIGAEDDNEARVGLANGRGELHARHSRHVDVQVEDVKLVALVGKVGARAGVRTNLKLQVVLSGKAPDGGLELASCASLVVHYSDSYHVPALPRLPFVPVCPELGNRSETTARREHGRQTKKDPGPAS